MSKCFDISDILCFRSQPYRGDKESVNIQVVKFDLLKTCLFSFTLAVINTGDLPLKDLNLRSINNGVTFSVNNIQLLDVSTSINITATIPSSLIIPFTSTDIFFMVSNGTVSATTSQNIITQFTIISHNNFTPVPPALLQINYSHTFINKCNYSLLAHSLRLTVEDELYGKLNEIIVPDIFIIDETHELSGIEMLPNTSNTALSSYVTLCGEMITKTTEKMLISDVKIFVDDYFRLSDLCELNFYITVINTGKTPLHNLKLTSNDQCIIFKDQVNSTLLPEKEFSTFASIQFNGMSKNITFNVNNNIVSNSYTKNINSLYNANMALSSIKLDDDNNIKLESIIIFNNLSNFVIPGDKLLIVLTDLHTNMDYTYTTNTAALKSTHTIYFGFITLSGNESRKLSLTAYVCGIGSESYHIHINSPNL